MKKLLLLVCFILLLYTAIAKEVQFEDWVYSEDKITLDNITYTFLIGNRGKSTLVKFEDTIENIKSEDCKVFGLREICVNSIEKDFSQDNYKTFITISYLNPAIKMQRKLSNNILTIGDTASFDVTVLNNGDAATNVEFIEDFPEQLEIIEVDTCTINENKIIYTGSLQKGESFSCSYTIRATGALDVFLSSSLTYKDSLLQQTIYSEPLHIVVKELVFISSALSSKEIGINEITTLNLSIESKEDLPILLEIKIPENVKVEDTSMEKVGNIYSWDSALNGTKLHTFTLKGIRSGQLAIDGTLQFSIAGIAYRKNINAHLEVRKPQVELTVNIEDNVRVDANEKLDLSIGIRNYQEAIDLIDLNLRVDSPLINVSPVHREKINENSGERLLDMRFAVPGVESTANYKLKANLSYKTPYGETFSEAVIKNIIVVPVERLNIIKKYSKKKIFEGEEIRVDVSIQNQRNVDLKDIYVAESLPAVLNKKGKTFAQLAVDKGKTVHAYTYYITGPDVVTATNYTINTSAGYEKDGKEYIFYTDDLIYVQPPKLNLNIGKAIKDKEIIMGQALHIQYSIQNKDTATAYDLTVQYPHNLHFDYMDLANYSFERIDPGEVINFNVLLRPTTEKRFVVDGTLLTYRDIANQTYRSYSNSLTIDADKANINGPAIKLKKTSSNYKPDLGEEVIIEINVDNIGETKGEVLIEDGGKTWERNLPPHSIAVINYTLRIEQEGSVSLGYTTASYHYLGNDYETVSNEVIVSVPPKETDRGTPEGVKTGNQHSLNNSKELNASAQKTESSNQKKGIITRFLDWLRSLW